MTPYWSDGTVSLYLGDCREVLTDQPDASVDAIVTDPPYELGFMGRAWDDSGIAYDPAMWAQCLRVLKPGGHMVAFGGTRTYHRMVCAVEDAGFEIRDSMHWIYGSGFPKSLDVSKAIDKAAGAERKVIGTAADFARDGATRSTDGDHVRPHGKQGEHRYRDRWSAPVTTPTTDDAARWEGWGTALKPSHEPIVLARRPLHGTVVANVLAHGTGALNIDGCRIGWDPASLAKDTARRQQPRHDMRGGRLLGGEAGSYRGDTASPAGRWPTNVVLSHPPLLDDTGQPIGDACADGCVPGCPVAELDRQSGHLKSGANPTRRSSDKFRDTYGDFAGQGTCLPARGADEGGASRFFPVFRYEAKAPTSERPRLADGTAHTTVKPLTLIRWIVRLVTPPGGLVLDPFAGSGTTGEACVIEGFRSLLIEQDPAHAELIKARLSKPLQPSLGFEVGA